MQSAHLASRIPTRFHVKQNDPLTQREVDRVRYRIGLHMVRSHLASEQRHAPLGVYHVWFPSNDLGVYLIKSGNPPHDSDRPRHLRNLRIEIDLDPIPEWLRDYLKPHGTLEDAINEAGRDGLGNDKLNRFHIELFDRLGIRYADAQHRRSS